MSAPDERAAGGANVSAPDERAAGGADASALDERAAGGADASALGVLLTCEHAAAAVPPGVELGVPADVRGSHIGWDAGAADVAAAVAAAVGCVCIAGRYTRLVCDLNRPPESPAAVPVALFGVTVPGNAALSAAERAARLAAYHAPHWDEVRARVEERVRTRGACLHLAIHSFDPRLAPQARAFDVGVLFDPGREPEVELAASLQRALLAAGHDTRPNEPYLGTDEGLTTSLRSRYAPGRYAGLEIEISEAVSTDKFGAARVAEDLAAWITETAQRWPG